MGKFKSKKVEEKEVTRKVKSNQRKPKERKSLPFLCGRKNDDGSICQHRTGKKQGLRSHQRAKHIGTPELRAERLEKQRIRAHKATTKISIYSLMTYREQPSANATKWTLMPKNSPVDRNDPVVRKIIAIQTSKLKKLSDQKPYFGSILVAYKMGKKDLGPEKTLKQKRKSGEKFNFHLYYGTHATFGPCPYFADTKLHESAQLTKLCLQNGYVCYTMNITFSGGSTADNMKRAFLWQHFHKTHGQMMRNAPDEPTNVDFKILNQLVTRKSGFDGELSIDQTLKTIGYAQQRTPQIPIIRDLLPTKQELKWERYDFTEV